jgi:hypothetical protein
MEPNEVIYFHYLCPLLEKLLLDFREASAPLFLSPFWIVETPLSM